MSDKEKDNHRNNPRFPTVSSGGDTLDDDEIRNSEPPPEAWPEITGYKIIEKLAEGGMGIVYLALQTEPIKRPVALKIIKPGMDSKQVIARFEAERQALALLDHSNIAHVYDAGMTDKGRPYFVMEYVEEGRRITDYCDQKKLTIEERLKLFIQVCEAVQHAHHREIIHRDIKPSNILVSIKDAKPILKIIDFGVAKALSQQLTEKTYFTEQGQFIGTPEYMSPEQADLTGQGVDERTDIYSLGVLLYELLTGVLPFDSISLRQAAFAEIQRTIREEEPPTPSIKLSSLKDAAADIADSRSTQVSTLFKSLYRELEWIPLKAMRKDRDRRYRTVDDLSADIINYLEGNPLTAGPESRIYKVRKFVKRNKIIASATSVVLIVLIVATVVSLIFAVRAGGLLEEKDELLVEKDGLLAEKEKLVEDLEIALSGESKAKESALKQEKETNNLLTQLTVEQAKTNDALDRETKAKIDALEQQAKAEAILDFISNDLLGFDPSMMEITLKDSLDEAWGTIETKFKDMPFERASLYYTLGRTYILLKDFDAAELSMKKSLGVLKEILERDNADTLHSQAQYALALVYYIQAETNYNNDKVEKAKKFCSSCSKAIDNLKADNPNVTALKDAQSNLQTRLYSKENSKDRIPIISEISDFISWLF